MKTSNKIWKDLEAFQFLMMFGRFVREERMEFESIDEARNFLIMALLLECISGSNDERQLMISYEEIEKLATKGCVIDSEELPIGKHKSHRDKVLQNVKYHLEGNVCWYEKYYP